MKVKDIVKLACDFLGNSDLATAIDGALTDEQSAQVDNLVKCFNLVNSEIAGEYLPILKAESLKTTDFKLNFTQFSSQPNKIISVRDTFGRPVRFKVFDSYLKALAGNVEVEYTTMPEKMDIDDEFSSSLPERVYAYGIAREFCFLQSLFDDADVWDDRFKNTLEVLLQRKSELRMPGRRWI